MNDPRPFLKWFESVGLPVPSLHVVLGSAVGTAFDESPVPKGWEAKGRASFGQLGFVASTVQGHKGEFKIFRHARTGKSLLVQVGRLHGYEGNTPRQVVAPLVCSALAGCETFLLTNAAGSLKKTFKTGTVMIIKDQVNMTGTSPIHGVNPTDHTGKALGPRFPDMSEAYDKGLRAKLKGVLTKAKFKVNEGIYLGLPGPTFETPSEVALYSKWGMGAVGMSTVWETIALRHMNKRVAGFSFISNMGCGLVPNKKIDHNDVEREGRKAAAKIVRALFDFAEKEFA